jgi:uncharacterized protein (DUF1778 family)
MSAQRKTRSDYRGARRKFTLRMTAEDAELLEEAAQDAGQSISDFIIEAAARSARRRLGGSQA